MKNYIKLILLLIFSLSINELAIAESKNISRAKGKTSKQKIGDDKDNGADGMPVSKAFDNRVTLLDLKGTDATKYSVRPFKSLNPEMDSSKYLYLDRICIALAMDIDDIECNGLKNKMFKMDTLIPEYGALLKNIADKLTWKLVDDVPEIEDEGKIKEEAYENVLEKTQMAKRTGTVVEIKRPGWNEYLDGFNSGESLYRPMNALHKIATITHEIIYYICSLQGDTDSERARDINALLYISPATDNIATSFKKLTGKIAVVNNPPITAKEIKWITNHFHKELTSNHSIGWQVRWTYGNARIKRQLRRELFGIIQASIRPGLIYYGQDFIDSHLKLAGTFITPPEYSNQTKRFTRFSENLTWAENQQFSEYISKQPINYIKKVEKNIIPDKANGLFIDNNIPLCDGAAKIDIPDIFDNRTFMNEGLPFVQISAEKGIFLSYNAIIKDKYQEAANLCVKYKTKDYYFEITLVNYNKIKFIDRDEEKNFNIFQTVTLYNDNRDENENYKINSTFQIQSVFDYEVFPVEHYDNYVYIRSTYVFPKESIIKLN